MRPRASALAKSDCGGTNRTSATAGCRRFFFNGMSRSLRLARLTSVALLAALATIGTAAMLWVGGGILVHGLHEYHLDLIPDVVEALGDAAGRVPFIGPVSGWLATAAASAVVGLVTGGIIVAAMHVIPRRKHAAH